MGRRVLPLCGDAVYVFYSPSQLGCLYIDNHRIIKEIKENKLSELKNELTLVIFCSFLFQKSQLWSPFYMQAKFQRYEIIWTINVFLLRNILGATIFWKILNPDGSVEVTPPASVIQSEVSSPEFKSLKCILRQGISNMSRLNPLWFEGNWRYASRLMSRLIPVWLDLLSTVTEDTLQLLSLV